MMFALIALFILCTSLFLASFREVTSFAPHASLVYHQRLHTISCSRSSSSTSASTSTSTSTSTSIKNDSHEDIEPYIGPISSLSDMEGGIAISENALQVLVGPSLVAPGRGLFLSIFNEDIESDNFVEEVIIPHGTPLCGYGRGYFTSEETGDKSVSFSFASDTVVFFEKKLMGIGDAIVMANTSDCEDEETTIQTLTTKATNDLLWGHVVEFNSETGQLLSIKPDDRFDARIFIPDENGGDDGNAFGAPSLGMYANDLAYDPDAMDQQTYLDTSNQNNILQLIWRLAKDEKTGLLVPTWPVVIARKDFRLVNTVPMEVGLQYGYKYWESFTGHPHD